MSKWSIVTNWGFLFFLVGVMAACTGNKEESTRVEHLPFFNDASFTPRWIDPDEITDDFHQIPGFQLIDQHGNTITEKELDGQVTVVDFFFTSCPGICPKMMDNMLLVQDAFLENKNLQILSHSVTPEYDSTTVLQAYAERKGIISDRWHLLTGSRSEIYNLGRNHYFIEEDLGLQKDPEDFIHTENFVLIDQNRRIRGIYNGLSKSSIHQLIIDASSLSEEN